MRHPSAHNLLSDRQYGFRKGRSTDDLLVFLTESCSSSFRDFDETFAVGLDISKAFDRVWHKSLISKLPSYGFYPSLCDSLSHRRNVASLSIFFRYIHADCSSELANCMPPPSRGIAAQDLYFFSSLFCPST